MNQAANRLASAASRALDGARRCTALVGAAVLLSALASSPAHAGFSVYTSDVVTQLADGNWVITYTVQNTSTDCSDNDCAIVGFSLPEYKAGDIDFNAPDSQLPGFTYADRLYPEWHAYEDTNQLDAGTATLSGPPAAAYVHLTAGYPAEYDSEAFIYPGESLDFTAVIPGPTVTGADFGYFTSAGLYLPVEPDIPAYVAPTTGVPEPSLFASLGIGGLGALLARRRRKS